MSNRIGWVDCLRCIGLLLVIASHVFGNASPGLQLLFGCNVPIMVFVSGYCSAQSAACSVRAYYLKRAKQLIAQPWLFFAIYFLMIRILTLGKEYPYSIKQILYTFLFLDGIGYTWIIAVFLFIAFITPIIRIVLRRYKHVKHLFPIIYWISSVLLMALRFNSGIVKVYLYGTGYVFLSFIGYVLFENRGFLQEYLTEALIAFLLCAGLLMYQRQDLFDLAGNKYPPTAYYIAYGLIVSVALMQGLAMMEGKLSGTGFQKCVTAFSKMSFDFYLWHILGLYLAEPISNVFLRFFVVLLTAAAGALSANVIKGKLSGNRTI